MTCKRNKDKISSAIHRHAVGDPYFYSSETTNVGNDQRQDRRSSLPNSLQSDRTLQACTPTRENAVDDPYFYSSESNVDNDRCQDRRSSLPNSLQSDPTLQTCTNTKENKAVGEPYFYSSESTVDNNDQRQQDRRSSLPNSLQSYPTQQTCTPTKEENSTFLPFNQEVPGDPSSPASHQLIGSEIGLADWMEQAHATIFSTDEEQEGRSISRRRSYHGGYDNSASSFERGHADGSTVLREGDQQKHGGDVGFFMGKKFFDVAGTKMPLVEDFSAVGNRGGHMFYMPRRRSAFV